MAAADVTGQLENVPTSSISNPSGSVTATPASPSERKVRSGPCYKWERLRTASQQGISSRVNTVTWMGDERTIYSYGGCSAPVGATRHLEHCSTKLNSFDVLSQQWNSTNVAGGVPVEGAAYAPASSQTVYVFGGRRKAVNTNSLVNPSSNVEYSNSVSRLQVTKQASHMVTFHNEGVVPAPVQDAAAVIHGNRIVVFSGFTEHGFSDSVYIGQLPPEGADANANVLWVKGELVSSPVEGYFPVPRRGHSLTPIPGAQDRFMLVGGTNGVESFNDIWELHVKDNKVSWAKITSTVVTKDAPFLTPRAFHTVVPFAGDKVLFFGGCDTTATSSQCYNDVYILNTAKWGWEQVPSSLAHSALAKGVDVKSKSFVAGSRAPSPRRGTSAVVIPASATQGAKIALIGGCSLNSCGEDSAQMTTPNAYVQRHIFMVNLDAVCKDSCVNGAYVEEVSVANGEMVSDDEYIGPHCRCTPFSQGKFCQNTMACPNGCSGKGKCVTEGDKSFCQCSAGFWGVDCATPLCRNNCHGRGVCRVGPNPLYTSKTPFSFASATATSNNAQLQDMLLSLSDQAKAAAKDVWFRSQSHCECRPGFYGRECALVKDVETANACPNACSGHGLCDSIAGRCQCNAGFSGADCSIECPSHCSLHGVCTHDGICQCKPGFSGPDCSVRECLNDCSNNGVCDDNGKCQCVNGWGGESCNIRTDCSGHGKFVNGKCQCDDGWANAQCSQPVVCAGGCSDRGVCALALPVADETRLLQKPIATSDSLDVLDLTPHLSVSTNSSIPLAGVCKCPVGWRGDKCQFRSCPLKCRNGFCGDDGSCVCFPGHHGPDCSIPSNCPHNCTASTHGICEPNGSCKCHNGWFGADCGVPGCPNNCSGNGECHDGQCYCKKGFSGPDCATECTNKCSGRGQCISGKCQCDPGFEGVDCSVPMSCPRSLSVNPQMDCSGRGFCWRSKRECVCEPDFTGPDCSQPVGVCAPDTCGAHGTCRNGQCFCDLGWSGKRCDVANQCNDNCNDRGLCLHGRCHCYPGYEGDACERYIQDKTCINGCSGNGFCMHGRCYCQNGFGGKDCSETTGFCATTNCSGNGKCRDGKCYCQAGSSGLHCELGGCRNCDTNNGMCVNGSCHCKPGFTGTDCKTQLTCPNGCANHGVCILGTCACVPGFSGQDCSVATGAQPFKVTRGGVITNTTVSLSLCNNRGVYKDGQCFCVEGFEGLDCAIVKESTCPNKCGQHGECRFNKCWCQPGYYGKACEFKRSCDKCVNGVCHHNMCHCLPGFVGEDCNIRDLTGTVGSTLDSEKNFLENAKVTPRPASLPALLAFEEDADAMEMEMSPVPTKTYTAFASLNTPCGTLTHGCSQHGICTVTGNNTSKCVCANGYAGVDCSLTVGGSMWHRCPQNCHGRGTCLLGKCYCDLGFSGETCGEAKPLECPADCSGPERGVCQHGRCYCLPGFKGKACEHEVPCERACGAHGICFRDKCICAAGYQGDFCERPYVNQPIPAAIPGKEATDEINLFTLLQVGEQPTEDVLAGLDVSLVMEPSEVNVADSSKCGRHGHWVGSANACFCQSGYTGSTCDVKVDTQHGLSMGASWLRVAADWVHIVPLASDINISMWLLIASSSIMGLVAAYVMSNMAAKATSEHVKTRATQPLL